MAADDPIQHSTLEVDYSEDGRAAPIVSHDPTHEKIPSNGDPGKLAVATEGYDSQLESCLPAYEERKEAPLPPIPAPERKICGLRRRTFIILLSVVVAILIAIAIGGGLGGAVATKSKKSKATTTVNPAPSPPLPYANTGLASMLWTDLNGTLHKRLYYQDKSNTIRESSWDNSTAVDTAWQVNSISDAVKPGTPLAAAAGYPHANYTYSLVCIVTLRFMYYADMLFSGQKRVLHVTYR